MLYLATCGQSLQGPPFLTLPSSKPINLLHLAEVNDDEICAECVLFTSPHCCVLVQARVASHDPV